MPYPSLVCNDDLIYVYVSFQLILSTNSSDDAVEEFDFFILYFMVTLNFFPTLFIY